MRIAAGDACGAGHRMRGGLRSLRQPARAAQEAVQKQVPATRSYKEILDRKDVDAVIVAVPTINIVAL